MYRSLSGNAARSGWRSRQRGLGALGRSYHLALFLIMAITVPRPALGFLKAVSREAVSMVDGTLTPLESSAFNATISWVQSKLAKLDRITCVEFEILRQAHDPMHIGDGFVSLAGGFSSPASQRIQAARPGTGVPVNATELTGANIWLMGWISDLGGFTVDYEVFKVPDSVNQAWSDAGNDTAVIINYLFYNVTSSKGRPYDCVVTGTKQDALRATTMDFLVAHQPYSYMLATFIPDPLKTLIGHTLTTWADPFSKQVWGVVSAVLILSVLIMYAFECEADSITDFGPETLPLLKRMGRGFFKSMSTYTMIGSFEPNTPAGRFYGVTYAFVVLLIQSAYTANLAGYFIHSSTIVPSITSADTLMPQDLVCYQSDSMDDMWINGMYAMASTSPSPLGSLTAMYDWMLHPPNNNRTDPNACDAILAPDVDINWALGPGDTNVSFCSIISVGGTLSTGNVLYYAIPFRQNSTTISKSEYEAFNTLVVDAIVYGAYQTQAADVFFPKTRSPECQTFISASLVAAPDPNLMVPLGTKQMAGVLFVQVCGLGMAMIVHLLYSKHGLKGALRRAKNPKGEFDDEMEDDGVKGAEEGGSTQQNAMKSNMRDIPLHAMEAVDSAIERVMTQIQQIQQQQRQIDVVYMMQEQDTDRRSGHVPLHVVTKMDRAVGFGVHAKSSLVLLDQKNAPLAKATIDLTQSADLSQAFLKMGQKDAVEFDKKITDFLEARKAELKSARRGGQKAIMPRDAIPPGMPPRKALTAGNAAGYGGGGGGGSPGAAAPPSRNGSNRPTRPVAAASTSGLPQKPHNWAGGPRGPNSYGGGSNGRGPSKMATDL